jgi:hypothetical protein
MCAKTAIGGGCANARKKQSAVGARVRDNSDGCAKAAICNAGKTIETGS